MSEQKKRADRADKAVKEKRISIVFKLLVQGYQRKQIYESLRTQEKDKPANERLWDISFRSFRHYCQLAKEQISEHAKYERDYYLGRGICRLDEIYAKFYSQGNYRDAMIAEEKLEKLLQLGGTNINIDSKIFDSNLPTQLENLTYYNENEKDSEHTKQLW